MTTYILNRHRFVLHKQNGEISKSGNRAHIKDPMVLRDLDEADRMIHAGAKLCAYCFPNGWHEQDEGTS